MPVRQLDKIKEIENIEKSLWVEVLKIESNDCFAGSDVYKIGILLKKNKQKEELKEAAFNHLINFEPYCYPDGIYLKFGNENIERLCSRRKNVITKKDELSITEEFVFFHNLYRDGNIYYKVDESLEREEVVKIERNSINIKNRYLKQYLAIKDMVLIMCFEYRYYHNEETIYEKNEKIKNENMIYTNFISNETFTSDYKSMGWIMGKKIIKGMKKEETGLWEYPNNTPKYLDFIIGIDENCEEKVHTCDPSTLGDFYNNINPDFLTRVYFTKNVLSKYYENDNFEVDDNHIRAYGWYLKIDNQRDNIVSVYLGDLANLPYKEQLYWKSFNIIEDLEITKTSYERDFMGMWSNPESLDLVFKEEYKFLNDKWFQKFDWKLFKDLNDEDAHNFDNLRIPVSASQGEFDSQVLALVKTLIDSLNEKEIGKVLPLKSRQELKGGISKLEEFLKLKILNNNEKIEEHIKNLRSIQSLRSTGAAHRKSDNYKKAKRNLNFNDKNHIQNFKIILNYGIEFIKFIKNELID